MSQVRKDAIFESDFCGISHFVVMVHINKFTTCHAKSQLPAIKQEPFSYIHEKRKLKRCRSRAFLVKNLKLIQRKMTPEMILHDINRCRKKLYKKNPYQVFSL